jgi:hypothetical protein
VLAEEEVAVVEGCSLNGNDEVVGARSRSWDVLEGEAIIWKLEGVKEMGNEVGLTGSKPVQACPRFAGL